MQDHLIKQLFPLPDVLLFPIVQVALQEDLGRRGDITSQAIISSSHNSSLELVSRQDGVIAGMSLARLAFLQLDNQIQFIAKAVDGQQVVAGQSLAKVSGNTQSLLAAERTALNFLTHLSGIATDTAKVVKQLANYKTNVTCTRKTVPGLRMLQKYAVRAGGGVNHRLGLDDAFLIKDNHIALAGGIAQALNAVQNVAGHLLPIEIEVDTLEQLEQALSCGANLVLLDNMNLSQLSKAVAMCKGKAKTEASGGIIPATVAKVAATGVDYVAMGWLTHSSKALDIGFDVI